MYCRHPITKHIAGRARARTCQAVCKARERFQASQNKSSDNFPRTHLFDVLREGRPAGCSPNGSLRGGQLGPSAAAGRLLEHGQPRRQRHATTSHQVNANHSRSLLALSRSLRTGGPACSPRLPRSALQPAVFAGGLKTATHPSKDFGILKSRARFVLGQKLCPWACCACVSRTTICDGDARAPLINGVITATPCAHNPQRSRRSF